MMDARTFLETTRRRIINVTAIALTIASGCLTLVMSLVFILAASQGAGIIALAGVFGLIGMSMTWALIARAPLWLAVLPMLVALLLSAILVTLLLPELGLIALVCLLLAISISTLSNSRRLTLNVALVGGLLGVALTGVALPTDWTFNLGAALPIICAIIIVIVTSGAALLADRFIASQNAALALAEQRSTEAEAARAEAAAAHTEVERLQVAEQQRLIALVETLELPIIAVGGQMLVVPLVGELDGRRIVNIQARLLDEVSRQRASTVVLDLTGVNLIDTHVAQQLVLMAQAVRLLGARILLSGIRADVAHTMVTLAIDLTGMQPVANLGAALQLNDRRSATVAHLVHTTVREN